MEEPKDRYQPLDYEPLKPKATRRFFWLRSATGLLLAVCVGVVTIFMVLVFVDVVRGCLGQ